MKLLSLLVLSLLAGSLAAQGRITQPTFTRLLGISQQFIPPPQYEQWYDELVKECDCRPATTVIELTWYEAPRDGFYCEGQEAPCTGQWINNGVIFIAANWRMDERTVKHELLHAILNRGDHPRIFQKLNLDGGESHR